MKLFFKRLFFRPIYRVDVIDWAIKHHKKYEGICMALYDGLKHAGIKKRQYLSPEGITHRMRIIINDVFEIFPAHNYANARHMFNAWNLWYEDSNTSLWWESRDWDGGRLDYLNWLRGEYEDDKTPIKSIL